MSQCKLLFIPLKRSTLLPLKACRPVFENEKSKRNPSLLHFGTFKLTLQVPKLQSLKLLKFSGGFSNMAVVPSDSSQALLYCILLAFQFGLQPMIANRFTSADISKTSVVIGTEFGKIIIAFMSIMSEPSNAREKVLGDWTLYDSIKIAALPATLYAIQNLFVQHGYVLLDSMTFNLLNQTKTLSAAFWLYVVMGQKQSFVQIFALTLLLLAAYILNTGGEIVSTVDMSLDSSNYRLGLMMVLGASMLSGLSAALTQKALVGSKPRHPLFFSAELAVYGIIFLVVRALFSVESQSILSGNLFAGWNPYTFIPVTTNAFGGLVVGLVTKYAGGVVKGFALIAGLIITGLAQWIIDKKALASKDWVAIFLVSVSIYLHSTYPIPKKSVEAVVEKASEAELKKKVQ